MSTPKRVKKHIVPRGLLLVAALVFGVAACASLPPEYAAYLVEMRSAPTTFRVSSGLDGKAWERARAFVSRFSSMKIRVATDTFTARRATRRDSAIRSLELQVAME